MDGYEIVPRPELNGWQMACVDAHFALTETPAIAHFAAVHHHMEQVLETVAVNDRKDWVVRNINRVRRELDLLESAMKQDRLPLDLTERHSPTYFRPAFEGIPAGLRQPFDASRGERDFSRAYRPTPRRRSTARFPAHLLLVVILAAILLEITN
ncbi:hypothetical protein ACF1AE_21775 [Streptomyces sp. NPDC014986]|uniref:hypothetical protein n=1 Tax=Streptomyces sp. NPDC014986 TaxID=3364934 RepID=UPI0036F7F710